MPTSYEEFNWRPNDNSATTNLRYTLEAEKWVNAVSSAQRKARPGSSSGGFAFIGLLIQLVFCVSLLILLGILKLITLLVRLVETSLRKKDQSTKSRGKQNRVIFNSEVKSEEDRPEPKLAPEPEKKYPEGWQLIFWNSWGGLRPFWQFVYLFIFIFLVEVVVFFLLNQWIPEYVSLNRDVLLFAAGVSLWNAFLGIDV